MAKWAGALLLSALTAGVCAAAAQDSAAQSAAEAMQRGDFQGAENTLRADVAAHPDEAWSLSLLGVALDRQKKLAEAEEFHRRAAALGPHNTGIMNNYGTHQWMAGEYDKAEASFSAALEGAPAYFNALFNLGVMASFNRHYERAREALESALRQQPENVNVLYALASAEEASRQWERAVAHCAQALKIDPKRADVEKLLAISASELGALDDAAAAWSRYLALEPSDEKARRERGFAEARIGKIEEAKADLEWYAARHPDDPVGQYELAEALRTVDAAQAIEHLTRAIELQADYAPALEARGSIYYQQGKPELARADLERAAAQQPEDAGILDRLGQTYGALERPADAVRALRKAAQLAPGDSTIALHFGRALADAGEMEESKAAMERFRQLGPAQKKSVPAGLVDYLAMTPEQRRADYRARVEKAVREHPEDAAAQVEYLKLAIAEHQRERVAATEQRIAALKPPAALLADAGRALLAGDYAAEAGALLAEAAKAAPHDAGVELDLAVATFRAKGATAGLDLLGRIPEAARNANYDLARAQMLDAAGKTTEASAAIDRALRAEPQRQEVYREAVALLVKRGNKPEALRIAEAGARALPDDRGTLLLKATTLDFAGQAGESGRALDEIRGRWPEWPDAWVARGIILAARHECEEARHDLETGVALGMETAKAYYGLADCKNQNATEAAEALERLYEGKLGEKPE